MLADLILTISNQIANFSGYTVSTISTPLDLTATHTLCYLFVHMLLQIN